MALRYMMTACLLAAGFATTASAQKGDEKEPNDAATVRTSLSKAEKSEAKTGFDALTINFAKELGLPFDYLASLGNQIFEARRAPDPVGLAAAARNLAVAEKVAGKKASLTADDLFKEAVELAKLRGYSQELNAVALMVPEESAKKDLQKLASAAKDRETSEQSGERKRGLIGTLEVVNHTSECLQIYANGQPLGVVHSGQTALFHVHDHNHVTHFDAYCLEDGELVREGNVFGHRHYANWHIDE